MSLRDKGHTAHGAGGALRQPLVDALHVELVVAGQPPHHLALLIGTQTDCTGRQPLAVGVEGIRLGSLVVIRRGQIWETGEAFNDDPVNAAPAFLASAGAHKLSRVLRQRVAKEPMPLDEALADGHEEAEKQRDRDAQHNRHVGGEGHEAARLCTGNHELVLHVHMAVVVHVENAKDIDALSEFGVLKLEALAALEHLGAGEDVVIV
mmetsp:Transcript_610/g.1822  ORF Transcript_610/g.1822 Transcript_610/m.1822 type:complete len:207 (-) Transcript_610:1828-2448(-)